MSNNALIICPVADAADVKEVIYAFTGNDADRTDGLTVKLARANQPGTHSHWACNFGAASDAFLAALAAQTLPGNAPVDVESARTQRAIEKLDARSHEDDAQPVNTTKVIVRTGPGSNAGIEALGFVRFEG